MSQAPDITDTSMLSATLQRLHADGALSVGAVCDATQIDASSVYKWMAGQHDPSFSKIALLFRHCDNERVQAAILDLLTRGTPWRAVAIPKACDIDGDGDVDTDDALASAVAALQDLAELLDGVRKADGVQIDGAVADSLDATGNAAIRKILAALRCVAFVHEQQQKRRKARQVTTTNAG